ncbi:MAG: gamma carbonic anhydrase family protein [Eubacterium sp.]|nr:gamma carbonic anhydrase family protein [Eubacterium sp.]
MILEYNGKLPTVPESVFVAEGAAIIGDTVLGEGCSVWFSAVIRGDENSIRIGSGTNIQDNATIHCDAANPVTVGNDVTIGHNAVLHGCTVKDGALIGMNAVVLDGAVIGKNCLVGAGALVTEGKVFEDNTLIIGSPARAFRMLNYDDLKGLKQNCDNYKYMSGIYLEQNK